MKKIVSISIKRIDDDFADLSYLGEFANQPEGDFSVKHDGGRDEYAWFNAENVENMEQAEQNYERVKSYGDSWACISIKAEAEVAVSLNGGQSWLHSKIDSSGLWGIDSDSPHEYFKEIEEEQIAELRALLLEYGFSKEEVLVAVEESVSWIA